MSSGTPISEAWKPQAFTLSKSALALIRSGVVAIELRKAVPATTDARDRMRKTIDGFFAQAKLEIVARLMKRTGARKARASVRKLLPLRKDDSPDKYTEINWKDLPEQIREDLAAAAIAGVETGFAQLGIDDENMISAVNSIAREWAFERAAELVGMKYVDGELVQNPKARWRIDENTREELNAIVTEAFEKESSITDVSAAISEAGAFADWRADMIAITETTRAQGNGNLESWKRSDVVEQIIWKPSFDHAVEDECDELAAGGPYDINDVPDYPAHPRCECSLIIAKVKEATQ